MATKRKVPASIEEIKRLYMRAEGYSIYVKDGETRHIEAFLLLGTILEGVLASYGLRVLKTRAELSLLGKKRSEQYGFANSINDLHLLGVITPQEFNDLHSLKKRRNYYVHGLLSNRISAVEEEARADYNKYAKLVWRMIAKLEKSL